MFKLLAAVKMAFTIVSVADLGVRQVQEAIPDAAGSTKLNVVLGTIEGALNDAEEATVDFATVKPALTGAINALVAGYKAAKNPAFVTALVPTEENTPSASAPAAETATTGTAIQVPTAAPAPAAPAVATVS